MGQIIKTRYEKSKTYVRTDVKGQTFKIGRGVKQGDPLSPNLFNCVLEEIFCNLNWEEMEMGIKIDGIYLNNLRFTDDVVQIGKRDEELQKMFLSFTEESKKGRIRVQHKQNEGNEQ